MATTKLYLKNKNAVNNSVILLFLMTGDKIIKISTREKINPKFWDSKERIAKRNYHGASELNEHLRNFSNEVMNIYRQLRNEKTVVDLDSIKAILYKDEIVETKLTVWKHYENFKLFKSKECTPNTIKKYQSLLNHLEAYSKKYGKIEFEDFNIDFYEKFTGYLIEELGLTNNTIGKYIQGLKTFLSWCFDRGFLDNLEFKKYKKLSEKTDIVYLNEMEIGKIKSLDLSKKTKLERVRDIFLFACHTGQRYSDIQNIKWADIRDNVWYVRVQKTKDTLEIPLVGTARVILEKYKGHQRPLPSISNQKMNEYLKELIKAAEIVEPISTVRYSGTKRIEETKPKYDLVTTHTARRTFVTLSLEKGMRPETVMEITGHKDYSIFRKYIKITSKVKQNEMEAFWS